MNITPTEMSRQGVVSVNLKLDRVTLATRDRNSGTSAGAATKSYPGGNDKENLVVLPGEPVFSTTHELRTQSGNRISAMSSINGHEITDAYGRERTVEEIAEDFLFAGVATTKCDPRDRQQVNQGYAGIIVGTSSIYNTGRKSFVPGQKIMWKIPAYMGGPYTDSSRNRRGITRQKIRPILEPVEPGDAMPSINSAIAKMKLTKAQGGVSDIGLREMGNKLRIAGSAQTQHAASLMYLIPMILARGIDWLRNQGRGLPASGLEFMQGVDPATILEMMRWMFPASLATGGSSKNQTVYQNLSTTTGASLNRNRNGFRGDNEAAAYAKLAVNMDFLLEGAWMKAKESMDSRIIGKALAKSKPGEMLDALFGHTHL